jgi:predicted kinase
VIADMHKAAPRRAGTGHLPDFAGSETAELAALGDLLGSDRVAAFSGKLRALAEAHATLAASRGARRCHGDLHLRNIVLWQGRPAPFDCIEFNEWFTDIDPLYDLAFLLMDLDHRGHAGLAVEVFNAWAERMAAEPGAEPETAYGGLALLPFFKACRAGIRAKVGALAAREAHGADAGARLAEARAYLDLALRYLAEPQHPRLIAVGGLSGSGKTTLARALAVRLGAVVLRSDAIRKGQWGVDVTQRLPAAAYAPEVSVKVYDAMLARARMALQGGACVILDAAHLRPAEREQAGALAVELGIPFTGLWLEAPVAAMKARLAARPPGASDATASVIDQQATYEIGPVRWHRLAASGSEAELIRAALAALEG